MNKSDGEVLDETITARQEGWKWHLLAAGSCKSSFFIRPLLQNWWNWSGHNSHKWFGYEQWTLNKRPFVRRESCPKKVDPSQIKQAHLVFLNRTENCFNQQHPVGKSLKGAAGEEWTSNTIVDGIRNSNLQPGGTRIYHRELINVESALWRL